MALDPSGNAVFVWQRSDTGYLRAETRARSAAGDLSTPQALSGPYQDAVEPRVAVDAAGNAVFAWGRVDASVHCGGFGVGKSACGFDARAGGLGRGVQYGASDGRQDEIVRGDAPASRLRAPLEPVGHMKRKFSLGWMLSLVLLALPATAQAAFSGIGRISPAGQNAEAPQVAMDPGDNSVFVWDNRSAGSIQARVRSAAGNLTATQTLSDVGQAVSRPRVDVDADGDAVFVWENTSSGRVLARARTAGGTLSPVQTLSVPSRSASAPQVGVDADGDAVFVWLSRDATGGCGGQGCLRVQARARSAAGVLSPIQTLTPTGANTSTPDLSVKPGGDAVFVWRRHDGMPSCAGQCDRAQTRARAADGTLSATQVLSASDRLALDPHVEVDPAGRAVFVWQSNDGTSGCGGAGCSRIEARSRFAGGTLSATQPLSGTGQNATSPDLAVDATGDALFTWQSPDATTACGGGGCLRIRARTRSAAGTLGATQTVSGPGRDSFNSNVAMDAAGNAAFLWQRLDGTTLCPGSGFPCARVVARSRSAQGALSAAQTLSAAGQDALSPALAVDPNGGLDPHSPDAVAVWERSDGTTPGPHNPCCERIEAAVQIAPSAS